jgi:hypothetical protein
MEAQVIFLNPFTFCSLYKWKFFICLFVDGETNGSFQRANELNRLNWLRTLNGLNTLNRHAYLCDPQHFGHGIYRDLEITSFGKKVFRYYLQFLYLKFLSKTNPINLICIFILKLVLFQKSWFYHYKLVEARSF